MRSDVTPFLWFAAAFMFAVVWKGKDQGKAVFLALAVISLILGVRSYAATKKNPPA